MAERGEWESDFVQYNVYDIVEFNGKRYRCLQAHKSQSDWTPTVTPALWEHVGNARPGGERHDQQQAYQPSYGQQQQQQQQKPSEKPPQQWQGAQQAPNPTANSGYTTENGVKVDHQETQKPWYDLDGKKKEELLAGGLVLGLGALAGGAYYTHEKHKKDGEAEKAQAWELQNWIVGARARTEEFLAQGPRAPVTWVLSEYFDKSPLLQSDLLLGGEEGDKPWYIARAPHNGGIQPGKCRPGIGAYIGFRHEAIHVKQFEALVGDKHAVRWVPHRGRFNEASLGARPIEGGREDDGTPLFIARGRAKENPSVLGFGGSGHEGQFPGKASPKLDGAYVTAGEKEVKVEEYEVLCYE